MGQQAPPQATYPFGQANAGVRTQVDAKVITKRSPIILIIRMALSCLHELRVSSRLRDWLERAYAYLCRDNVTGITKCVFFQRPLKKAPSCFLIKSAATDTWASCPGGVDLDPVRHKSVMCCTTAEAKSAPAAVLGRFAAR